MKIKYNITNDDLIVLYQFIYKDPKKRKSLRYQHLGNLGLYFGSAFLAFMWVLSMKEPLFAYKIGVLLITFAAIIRLYEFLNINLIIKRLTKKMISESEYLNFENEIEIEGDLISISDKISKTTFNKNSIASLNFLKNLIIIFLTNNQTYIIPRSTINTDDFDNLVEILKEFKK